LTGPTIGTITGVSDIPKQTGKEKGKTLMAIVGGHREEKTSKKGLFEISCKNEESLGN